MSRTPKTPTKTSALAERGGGLDGGREAQIMGAGQAAPKSGEDAPPAVHPAEGEAIVAKVVAQAPRG